MPNFRVVEHVTLPQLKIGADPVYVKFLSKIFEAEDTATTPRRAKKDGEEAPAASGRTMAPPELADVLNLVDGKQYRIIVNAVLSAELQKKYKDDGYVGQSFEISRNPLGGKRYATFNIARVEVDEPEQAHTSAKKSGK